MTGMSNDYQRYKDWGSTFATFNIPAMTKVMSLMTFSLNFPSAKCPMTEHGMREKLRSIAVQDQSFDGILRGCAHDETEGCVLSGELILTVRRPTKIRSLQTKFVGEIGVNFKTTNSMGVPTADGIESRLLCRKTQTHFDEEVGSENARIVINSTTIEPGTYRFPFEFNISGQLPHSFQGKHGYIKYELGAYAMRPLMNSDIHISHPIILRRCLMNSLDPVAPASQYVTGQMHSDILAYSATAPSMVYCEGGLLTMDLNLQLRDPSKYSVVMVTCGLQEKTMYRTTGLRSLTNQKKQYLEKSYPLGCSTFYPSEHKEYNPADLHNYNAIFRLCPRVHTDTRSSLILVQHSLIIKINIEENEASSKKSHRRQWSTESSSSTGSSNAAKTLLSHLSIKHHSNTVSEPIPIRPSSTVHFSPGSSANHDHSITTPPLSQSPSSDEFSLYSTSVESESSVTSLTTAFNQASLLQPGVVRVTSRKGQVVEPSSFTSTSTSNPIEESSRKNSLGHHIGHSLSLYHNFKPLHFHRRSSSSKSYECCLKVPIIVTSREEYREGDIPALPDYETIVGTPPDYRSAIQILPPVPTYPSTSRNQVENHHAEPI